MIIICTLSVATITKIHHIRKTPKRVGCGGALSAALRLRPNIRRVSAGSITPSSHILSTQKHQNATRQIL